MKKNNLTILAVVFLGLDIVFTLAYYIYSFYVRRFYGEPSYQYGYYDATVPKRTIIGIVFVCIFLILLIVGVIIKNKIIFCVAYGLNIVSAFINMVYYTIFNISIESLRYFVPESILYGLSRTTFNIFMLLFILIVFKWKEQPVVYNGSNSHDKKDLNTDLLFEYKQLFDNGVITQEEFDKKKYELLNL